MSELVSEIVKRLHAALPDGAYLHEPSFAENEKAYLCECVDSTFVSSVGPFVDRFEKEFAEILGAKHVVATSSGTTALHTCFTLLDIGAGDEVLIPSLTFVATANALLQTGATPHFIESESKTLGVDVSKLARYLEDTAELVGGACVNKTTKKPIKAIVPVHVLGCPVDMEPLMALAEAWGLAIVEDAAEALGSKYQGKACGTFGKLAAYSFNGNKIVTAGGGGAVVTDDDRLAKLAKHLTTTAKLPHRWEFEHDRAGFNYRMPNVNAALLCAQLENLGWRLKQKVGLQAGYKEIFNGLDGVELFEPQFESNYWLIGIQLKDAELRDELLSKLHGHKIFARPLWNCLHQQRFLESCPRMDLTVAEQLVGSLITLPSSSHLELRS